MYIGEILKVWEYHYMGQNMRIVRLTPLTAHMGEGLSEAKEIHHQCITSYWRYVVNNVIKITCTHSIIFILQCWLVLIEAVQITTFEFHVTLMKHNSYWVLLQLFPILFYTHHKNETANNKLGLNHIPHWNLIIYT